MALSVCSSCQRHVKGNDACPFCGGATSTGPARRPPSRVARAAMLFGAAAVSAACSSSTPEPKGAEDSGSDAPPLAFDAAYGAPPPRDAGPDPDAADGGPVAMYGAPAPDAATDAEAPDGGGIALYGAPAP